MPRQSNFHDRPFWREQSRQTWLIRTFLGPPIFVTKTKLLIYNFCLCLILMFQVSGSMDDLFWPNFTGMF